MVSEIIEVNMTATLGQQTKHTSNSSMTHVLAKERLYKPPAGNSTIVPIMTVVPHVS